MFVTRAISVGAAAILSVGSALAADPVQVEAPLAPTAESANSAIVSLWLGGNWLDTDDSDFDEDATFAWGGDGRGYIEVSPGFGLQLEIVGLSEGNADADDDDEGTIYVSGGLHLIGRGNSFDYGAFAALNHTQFNDTGDDAQIFFGGIEGAYHMGMTTLFGQIGGVAAFAGDDDTWESGGFGRLGARHFFTDYSKLEGHVAAGTGEMDSGSDDDDFWAQWRLEYERQINMSPLSWSVAYQGDYLTEDFGDDDDTLVIHSFRIGLSASIGAGGSLYSIGKHGAGTFNLPDLHVPFSYVDDL